ncbi:MAG: FKBP-type peptidyl-prolyl cis-trans isomerase [Candidatus Wildermuthbacteria bacterium]|nr:FKBP-type peptidyl-prolyl cis-trans isomerase [Candidatus Wildermuthbacteria bacterium]
MKEFFIGIVIIVLLGAGSYFFVSRKEKTPEQSPTSGSEDRQGVLTPAQNAPQEAPQKGTTASAPAQAPASLAAKPSAPVSSAPPSTLQVETVQAGSGVGAQPGNTLQVHYTGNLWGGGVFDSSYTNGVPFEFTLGRGEVILGWDEGMVGMKKGEVRKLVIPPDYGYGQYGTPGGAIPPNATLVFTVELLSINGN